MHTVMMDCKVHTFVTFQSQMKPDGPRVKVPGKLMISETALEYFTLPDMMGLIMLHGWSTEDYGRALAHLCYKNKKLSKLACKYVLTSLKHNDDAVKLPSYLSVIEELVQVRDDLQINRLEWIFGFG